MAIGIRNGSSREPNGKTLVSFDLTTICPKAERGEACAYCYVETGRDTGVRAKRVKQYTPYEKDRWPLTMTDKLKRDVGGMGGIRMFASSDYRASERRDVEKFLADCLLAGVKAKAITKQEIFVLHHHDHEALATIHVSIDRLGTEWGKRRSPIGERKALSLKKRFGKVQIRAVCLSVEDVEYYGGQDYIDILTLNHGRNGFHWFKHEEVARIAEKYPGRVCCSTSLCAGCPVRCGVV